MTSLQILIYEKSKKLLNRLELYRTGEITPTKQFFGGGSGSPRIEHDLEKIHAELHESYKEALLLAIRKTQDLIKEA
tara:strand:- start:52 stop:282 length:231 start_codon:yes stop_codon:yes gene_type:complete